MDKWAAIAIMAGVTFLIRLSPFLIFSKQKKTPDWIVYLGRVLPPAVMGMLIVYSLKSVDVYDGGSWIPVVLAVVSTILLHLVKRNNLLSILGGTAIYMMLIQWQIF